MKILKAKKRRKRRRRDGMLQYFRKSSQASHRIVAESSHRHLLPLSSDSVYSHVHRNRTRIHAQHAQHVHHRIPSQAPPAPNPSLLQISNSINCPSYERPNQSTVRSEKRIHHHPQPPCFILHNFYFSRGILVEAAAGCGYSLTTASNQGACSAPYPSTAAALVGHVTCC